MAGIPWMSCALFNALLFLSILMPSRALVRGQLTEPLNVASLVGESAIIQCQRVTQSVAWHFISVGTGSSGIIAVDCRPIASVSGIYKIDTANGACNLVIENVTVNQAGTYSCQDLGSTDPAYSAELIVLEAPPSCRMNTTTQGVVAAVPVLFSCSINFAGVYSPEMKWRDVLGKEMEKQIINTNSSFFETGVVIPAGLPVLMSVSCQSYFSSPPDKPPSSVVPAENAPSYSSTWTTPPVETFYATDCSEILTIHPGIGSGVYYLKFTNKTELVKVYCDMTTSRGGWTVFQRRIDGSVIFYRPWLDYYTGFGDAAGEFWLGNEYISTLSATKRYKLRVDLGDWSGQYRYAEYSDFAVANATDKYRINFGVYNGDAGDSLYWHKGQQFSTYDQDNDADSSFNCAEYYRAAWWHSDCGYSSLNGQYNNTAGGEGVNWFTWRGYYYSLRFSEMKIRPVTF